MTVNRRYKFTYQHLERLYSLLLYEKYHFEVTGLGSNGRRLAITSNESIPLHMILLAVPKAAA